MYHTVLHRRIREERRLHSAMLELTYQCNLDCFFCYNDDQTPGRLLDTDQYHPLLIAHGPSTGTRELGAYRPDCCKPGSAGGGV